MRDSHLESYSRLLHIVQAIDDIEKYVEGQTSESFCLNDMLQDAVMMQFIVIGEAVVHVEHAKLDKYDYPWYKVKAFRNMIAHEYFNIKMSAVWIVVTGELPALRQVIERMLKAEF